MLQAEQDRLDLQHEIFRMLFDGWLALAPLTTSPKCVLDIATGTGVWVHDFGKIYPDTYHPRGLPFALYRAAYAAHGSFFYTYLAYR